VRVYFTLRKSPVAANSVITICIVGVSLAGCVHSSVNTKPGANGGVSYVSLPHSRLYCRDREKKVGHDS